MNFLVHTRKKIKWERSGQMKEAKKKTHIENTMLKWIIWLILWSNPFFPYSWSNKYFDVVYYLTKHLHDHETNATIDFYRRRKKICNFFLPKWCVVCIDNRNYFNFIWIERKKNGLTKKCVRCLFPYVWFLFMRYRAITIIDGQTVSTEKKICYSHCAEIITERSLKFNFFFSWLM